MVSVLHKDLEYKVKKLLTSTRSWRSCSLGSVYHLLVKNNYGREGGFHREGEAYQLSSPEKDGGGRLLEGGGLFERVA